MKKIYLSILIISLSTWSFGQVILNQNNSIPTNGTTLKYEIAKNVKPAVGTPGAGKTWDWSSFSGTSTDYIYKKASNGADGSNHTSATSVESTLGNENYYISSATEYTIEGNFIPSVARINYTDKREFLLFPMKLGSSYNKTFAGQLNVLSSGTKYDRAGTIKVWADAEGKLITPYGTINNVLKVTWTSDYTDKLSGTQIGTYQDTIMLWYDGVNKNFLGSYTVGWANGAKFLESSSLMEKGSVGLEKEINNASNFSIFPSPTSDYIEVDGIFGFKTLQIIDLSGQIVKTVGLNDVEKLKINVLDFKSGVYILKVNSETDEFIKRFIVE